MPALPALALSTMLERSTDLGLTCLQVTFNCTQLVPTCYNPDGFDFPTLWNITQRYFEQCPRGPWIFVPHGQISVSVQEVSLTLAAAAAIVATAKPWTVYRASDIWFRLTTWKFPLWQLVANSPRPPLGWSVECFSVVRLLGNPTGSTAGLLSKLHDCQLRADYWRDQLNGPLRQAAQALSPTLTKSRRGFAPAARKRLPRRPDRKTVRYSGRVPGPGGCHTRRPANRGSTRRA